MKIEEIGPAAKRELALVENERTIAECKKETDLLVNKAVYWAQKLVDLVDKCGMSKEISGKKYLKVEAWQLIGEFAHTTSKVEWCNPWLDADNHQIGYKARVVLVNGNGEEVGAGESSCGFDAFPCRGKQGSDRERAAASSAQTWATSKAFRNKFSFVAVLGGYQPTPAEEMTAETPKIEQDRSATKVIKPEDSEPPGFQSGVEITGIFLGQSPKGLKLEVGDREPEWYPKSAVVSPRKWDWKEGQGVTLVIAKWLAQSKGFVPKEPSPMPDDIPY